MSGYSSTTSMSPPLLSLREGEVMRHTGSRIVNADPKYTIHVNVSIHMIAAALLVLLSLHQQPLASTTALLRGPPPPRGAPIGSLQKKQYGRPFEEDCYNVNLIILKERGAMKQGLITYRQGWDEDVLCDHLLKDESTTVAKNAEMFFEKCEKYIGNICRHECHTLSNLFDRMDYTSYPPNSENGGVDYFMDKDDCSKCLTSQDCAQTPRLTVRQFIMFLLLFFFCFFFFIYLSHFFRFFFFLFSLFLFSVPASFFSRAHRMWIR